MHGIITIDSGDDDYEDLNIIEYLGTYQTHSNVHTIDICTYTIFKSVTLHDKLCAFAKKCVNLKRIKLHYNFENYKLYGVEIVIKLLEAFNYITNVIIISEMSSNVYNICDINLLCCYLRNSSVIKKIKIKAVDIIIFNIVEYIKYNNSIKSINLSFTSITAPISLITTKINKVSFNYCHNISDIYCKKFMELNPSITKLKLFAIENIDLALKFIKCASCENLSLRKCSIDDEKIKKLSKALVLSNIKKFKIDKNYSYCSYTINSIINILSVNRSLTYVDIGKNWMQSKNIPLLIKSLATNSTIKTFLCQYDLADFDNQILFSEIDARIILKSLEETCINELSENYTLQHFAMVISYKTIFSECINLKIITDRNIELIRRARFIKTKVAPLDL